MTSNTTPVAGNSITPATPDPRAELLAGLRELADFIAAHPEMPIPEYPAFTHCIGPCPDADGLAVAQQLAEVLDVEPTVSGGHTDVKRLFRGLEYRAFYITRDRMAAHTAEQSYTRNVQVDGPSVLDGEVVDTTRALPATSSSANSVALLGVTR